MIISTKGIAIGAIAVAVTLILVTSGVGAVAGFSAVSVLGLPATLSAISIAVAAGGVGALNKLREYKIVEKSGDKLILKRA